MRFKRNIPLFYLILLFHRMIPAYVIERLFWADRGMTVGMVVACEILYAAVIVVLEIPSGVLADLLGRRVLLVIGSVTFVLEMGILLFATQFWHFALAVFLTAIGGAAVSGARNALLYDTLAESGETARFERHLGRLYALDAVSTIVAGLIGSPLAQRYGFELVYLISTVSCIVSMVLTFFLVEPEHAFSDEERMTVRIILRRARAFFKKRPDALVIMIQATVIAAFMIYFDEFWQLYLSDLSFPIALFGVIAALFAASGALGSALAERLPQRRATRRVIAVLSGTVTACLMCASLVRSPWSIAAMALAFFCADMMMVLAMGYLHRDADSSARATIESLASLAQRAASVVLGIVFAQVAARLSLFSAYGALALLCAIMTGWYLFASFKSKQQG